MSQKHETLLETIGAFAPRFSVLTDPTKNPIPVEMTADQVLGHLVNYMTKGNAFLPPAQIVANEKFAGYQLIIVERPADPAKPTGQPKQLFVANVHTDLEERSGPTDNGLVAQAMVTIAIARAIAKGDELHAAAEAQKKTEGEKAEGAGAADGDAQVEQVDFSKSAP